MPAKVNAVRELEDNQASSIPSMRTDALPTKTASRDLIGCRPLVKETDLLFGPINASLPMSLCKPLVQQEGVPACQMRPCGIREFENRRPPDARLVQILHCADGETEAGSDEDPSGHREMGQQSQPRKSTAQAPCPLRPGSLFMAFSFSCGSPYRRPRSPTLGHKLHEKNIVSLPCAYFPIYRLKNKPLLTI